MWGIIYEYLETDRDYVKRLGKLPYIHNDRRYVKATNMKLLNAEKNLCYLPLWNEFERGEASKHGTVAVHYLDQCMSMYSEEVNTLCEIEWDP